LKKLDLELTPWKDIQKKLRRVVVYAIEKVGVDDPNDFERLSRETFAEEKSHRLSGLESAHRGMR